MHDHQRPLPELETLLDEYIRTRSAELRSQIVESCLYIAEIIARRFSGRGVEYDDLYQVASLALVKGLERYDPSRDIKFVSYITPTMVGEVKNYFRDRSRTIRLPRRNAQLARSVREERDRLTQRLGRSPKVGELADSLHLTEEMVLEILELGSASAPASLDAQIPDESGETSLGRFLGFEDPEFERVETQDMLRRAMEALDKRQREIIRARFFEGLSQRDVARRLEISQMTVSRSERTALERLRKQMNEQE